MNDTSELDRLIDGELTDAERRELLRRLDAQPDGWRRCALAFLEAQTWQASLRTVTDEPSGTIETPPPLTTRQRSPQHGWVAMALAASIAVAFFTGFAGGDRWRLAHNGSNDTDHRTANVAPGGDPNLEANVIVVPASSSGNSSDIAAISDAGDDTRLTAQTVGWNGPRMRVGFVAVENEADGTLSHMPVKVVTGPGVDESWLDQVPPAVSARYVEILRRQGYEVEQQREIVPFDVADGQRVMLPVDHVKIIPISDVTY